MKASDCTFDRMIDVARTHPELAMSASYVQVEYGLAELASHWHGFVDTSDDHGLEFKSSRHICREFSVALTAYLRLLDESFSKQVGPQISANRKRGKPVE